MDTALKLLTINSLPLPEVAPSGIPPPSELASASSSAHSTQPSTFAGYTVSSILNLPDEILQKIIALAVGHTVQSHKSLAVYQVCQKFRAFQSSFKHITSVQLNNRELQVDTLEKVRIHCPYLRSLDLSKSTLNNRILIQIGHFTQLEMLNLYGCRGFNEQGLAELVKSLPNLQHLDLGLLAQHYVMDEDIDTLGLPNELIKFIACNNCRKQCNHDKVKPECAETVVWIKRELKCAQKRAITRHLNALPSLPNVRSVSLVSSEPCDEGWICLKNLGRVLNLR